MLRSTLLGCVAGLLLALDGLEFVQSRIATLDIFLMFWVLAAFACLVADRDWGRRRLLDRLEQAGTPFIPGPKVGFRPWRVLAAVCMAAAIATKWAGVFYAVILVVLMVAWDIRARRTAGSPTPRNAMLRYDALPLVGALLLVPVLYTATWAGWFATSGGYDRHWAENPANHSQWHLGPIDLGGLGNAMPDAVRSWVHYHHDIYQFHDHLNPKDSPDAHHPYQSHPWGWLALARPVSYFYNSPKNGEHGCTSKKGCSQEVLGIGTPAIWWMSMPVLALMAGAWVGRRDWRAGLAFIGVMTAIVPWIYYDYGGRTMFLFYALPAVPFMAMALAYCIGWAIGPPDAPPMRRSFGAAGAGAFVLVVLLNFFYLYPILAAQVIPYDDWHSRMWFPSWI
jgi:dolichyl-phosphate-mannose--protein O-mannosyl transferase